MMIGCSFTDNTGLQTPVHGGHGNVLWPESWTFEQKAEWRQQNNLPGFEWKPERSVTTYPPQPTRIYAFPRFYQPPLSYEVFEGRCLFLMTVLSVIAFICVGKFS